MQVLVTYILQVLANCQKIEKSIADILLTIYPYCCTTNTNDKEEKEYDYNGSDTSYQRFVFLGKEKI